MLLISNSDIFRSILGGLLLCLACSTLLFVKGRLPGFAGMVYGIIKRDNTFQWRSSLAAGLLFTGAFLYLKNGFGSHSENYVLDHPATFISGLDFFGWAISGLLIGVGSRWAEGCTSGHGLGGLPRLSRKSAASVATFVSIAMVVATLRAKYPFFDRTLWADKTFDLDRERSCIAGMFVSGLIVLFNIITNRNGKDGIIDIFVSFFCGILFAVAIIVGGVARRTKVLGFLTLDEKWDPSMVILGITMLISNFFAYSYILNRRPLLANEFGIPPGDDVIEKKMLIGSALFGIGWGISGFTPGSAFSIGSIYEPQPFVIYLPAVALGQFLADKITDAMAPPKLYRERPSEGATFEKLIKSG